MNSEGLSTRGEQQHQQSIASKHRRVTSFDIKVIGDPLQSQVYYADELKNKDHSSLIQSRNFGGNLEVPATDNGNSSSTKMSMIQTKSGSFSNVVTNHVRNNKSINLPKNTQQSIDHQSLLSSHRQKSSYQHSRNNSQKVENKEFFTHQQSYLSLIKQSSAVSKGVASHGNNHQTRNPDYSSKGIIGGNTFSIMTGNHLIRLTSYRLKSTPVETFSWPATKQLHNRAHSKEPYFESGGKGHRGLSVKAFS